jgi:hypothetical protein
MDREKGRQRIAPATTFVLPIQGSAFAVTAILTATYVAARRSKQQLPAQHDVFSGVTSRQFNRQLNGINIAESPDNFPLLIKRRAIRELD